MPRLLLVLSVAALLAGCGWNDCQTDFPDLPFALSGVLAADGSGVGDTLTVAIVWTSGRSDLPELNSVQTGSVTPTPSASGAVEVAYAVDGRVFEQSATPPLTSVLRGDTLFVAVEGAFDLLREACSPSRGPFYEVAVEAVRVPATIRAVRVATVSESDLDARTAAALRQLDADRLRPAVVA